jgi:hypothetical protein
MKNKIALILLAAAVGLIFWWSQQRFHNVDLTQEMLNQEATQLVQMIPWAQNAQVYKIGNYVVLAPSENPEAEFQIQKNGEPFINISRNLDGLSIGTAKQPVTTIFKNGKNHIIDLGNDLTVFETANKQYENQIRLSLSDSNGDGVYDKLSYSAIDHSASTVTDVIDFDLNGQADFKIIKSGDKVDSYAWFKNEWHAVSKNNKKNGITINGKWFQIELSDGKWVTEKDF